MLSKRVCVIFVMIKYLAYENLFMLWESNVITKFAHLMYLHHRVEKLLLLSELRLPQETCKINVHCVS